MRDVQIMDIAINLARIGNWAADDFDGKEKRIRMFLEQTKMYLRALDVASHPRPARRALTQFGIVFDQLMFEVSHPLADKLRWAEAILTWSNILTHRANFNPKRTPILQV